ncbi:MAG: hypothetical protein JXO72_13300 [Vicinamibacteria bacterium]|nr:hypothetical protein [Vicinamibacteria bacterium]
MTSAHSRLSRASAVLAVVLGSALFLCMLTRVHREHAIDGVYFHPWTSDHMMQVVSIVDVRDEPLKSLWYLHIQPPLLEALRTASAMLHRHSAYPEILRQVDRDLLVLWGACYAILIGAICAWLVRLTRPIYALTCAFLLGALHPAFIFYATYLDGTILSALLMTWFSFELWNARDGRGAPSRLIAAVILLFLTRSIFQLPFLAVVTTALALRGWSRRRLIVFVSVAGVLMCAYLYKQYRLFGVAVTSTFAGYNGCRSIDAPCDWSMRDRAQRLPPLPDPSRALALRRMRKPNGEYNFNQIAYLRISFAQMDQYFRHFRRKPFRETVSAYARNLHLYLMPSSHYARVVETEHELVKRLVWRAPYDRLFSGVPLSLLVAGAGLYWFIHAPGSRERKRLIGLTLPCLYVLLVSVVFEGGENMRFKFFIEPVLVVLLASTAYDLARRFASRISLRQPPAPATPSHESRKHSVSARRRTRLQGSCTLHGR